MKHINGYDKSLKTEEIVRRYQDGESTYSIARAYGRSVATIIYRLKQCGVYESQKERKRREEELAGVDCCAELKKLEANVKERKAGAMVELSKFICDHCATCEYATWRCEKAAKEE